MVKYALVSYAEWRSLSYRLSGILSICIFMVPEDGNQPEHISSIKINKQLLNSAFCWYLYLILLHIVTICYKIFHTTFIRKSF